MEDGVRFLELVAPVEQVNGKLKCEVMKLGDPDEKLKLQPRHVVANDEAYYAVMKGVMLFTPEAEKLMLTEDYFSARRQIRLCAPDLKRRNETRRHPMPVLKLY